MIACAVWWRSCKLSIVVLQTSPPISLVARVINWFRSASSCVTSLIEGLRQLDQPEGAQVDTGEEVILRLYAVNHRPFMRKLPSVTLFPQWDAVTRCLVSCDVATMIADAISRDNTRF